MKKQIILGFIVASVLLLSFSSSYALTEATTGEDTIVKSGNIEESELALQNEVLEGTIEEITESFLRLTAEDQQSYFVPLAQFNGNSDFAELNLKVGDKIYLEGISAQTASVSLQANAPSVITFNSNIDSNVQFNFTEFKFDNSAVISQNNLLKDFVISGSENVKIINGEIPMLTFNLPELDTQSFVYVTPEEGSSITISSSNNNSGLKINSAGVKLPEAVLSETFSLNSSDLGTLPTSLTTPLLINLEDLKDSKLFYASCIKFEGKTVQSDVSFDKANSFVIINQN